MQVKRVVLQNWRSHKDTRLEFSKGTNMLVGIMGSGKSSVLEGICFALYGTFPALARKRVKLGQVASEWAKGSECRAEIVFEKDGKEYYVARTIRDGKGDAELREGTRMLETKSEAVTRMIESILGVDYDLFSKVVYSEQNSLDYFLSLNPGDRKRQIDCLIGIDRFELARTNATKLINKISGELEEIEKEIGNYNKNALISERENLERQIREAREKEERLRMQLQEAAVGAELLKGKKDELEAKRKTFEELSRQEIECSAFVDSVGKELKNYRKEDMEKVRKEIVQLQEEAEALRKQVGKIEMALTTSNKKMWELEANLRDADAKSKERQELQKKLGALGTAGDAAQIRKEIEALNGQRAALEKEYGALGAELTLLKSDLLRLRSELEELERLKEDADAVDGLHQRDLDDARRSEESIIGWIASLNEMIKITQDSANALEKEGGSLCPVCESPLDNQKRQLLIIKRREIIENLQKELAENVKKLGKVRDEIRRIDIGLKKKAELGTKLEMLAPKRKELKEKTDRLGVLEEKVRDGEARLAALRSKIKEMDEMAIKAEEAGLLRQKIQEAEKFISQHTGDKQMLDELHRKHNDEESSLKGLRESLSRKEKDCIAKTKMEEEIARDLEMQGRVQQKKGQLVKVRVEISRIDYREEMLTAVWNAYNEALVKKREHEINLQNISMNIELLERNNKIVEKQLTEIENKERKIRNLREANATLREFQQSIIETQALLRSELVNSINAVMDKIWNVIYPYNDITQVRLEASESDYLLKARRNNEWVVIEGSVSGGERASATLAMRIALSIVLAPSLSILVLDEPTHNLDENGVKSLSEIFRERMPKIIGQSFIITHDEKLKDGASGKLYTLTRDKGSGGPTQIVPDVG